MIAEYKPDKCQKFEMTVRTRHSSSTNLSKFLGGSRPLLPTECPTLRDSLRQALYLQVHGEIKKNIWYSFN